MSNLSNIIAVSFKSIMKNKRRNILTIIGIVIGIAAVMLIMFLGNGFKQTSKDQIESSGAGKDTASIAYFPNTEKVTENPFKSDDISVAEEVDGVKSAKVKESDDSGYSSKMTNAEKNKDINVFKTKSLSTVDEGKGFSEEDNDLKNKVVIVDHSIAKKAFHNKAVGKIIYINNQGFEIVGVADKSSSDPMGLGGSDNAVQMPSKTFKKYMSDLSQESPSLTVKLTSGANKKEVANKVADKLEKRGSGADEGQYMYQDFDSMSKQFDQIFNMITYFVAAVAGISLFIAGIGVMNVMYISVAERTEEIAIRRAFGAKSRDIELQFLIESIVLCLLGGLIGLIIGILLALLVTAVTPDQVKAVITIGPIILAIGVSTLIGIIFGWVPARAAAKKELIDIIK
ncbi:ABC transporter permease [Staphylococcus sp. SQ8-PEA]|uniref:ABC transporter permease n=1 Tax=Staphylococcus marylandisciuri TaxID=2981529 RepID=A0ABT2QRS6_9STAP|nr:ABC transporter permease [Staphylococcus marylandisciuri]MCU5746663.1 ABC transporter permease [Staphylococcus marylandisciuri]